MIADWGEMRASLTGPTQFRTSLACFAICSSDSSLDVSAIIMGVDSKSLPANKQKNNDAAASQFWTNKLSLFIDATQNFVLGQHATMHCLKFKLINETLDVHIAPFG